MAISRKVIRSATVVALAGLAYSAFDLYGPRSHSLREFQPNEVARLETAMWQSYYAHDRLHLFRQLATLLRQQYDLPVLRSYVLAYHAAKAAVVFQAGHTERDYDKALPDLLAYYDAIRRVSREPFDNHRAARLELDWWMIHRERARRPRADLDRSLATLQAELFSVPFEHLMEHAKLRADAMLLRDRGAEDGSLTDQTWSEIDRLLRTSWQSLWRAVNDRAALPASTAEATDRQP